VTEPAGPGAFVAVAGASGVGEDARPAYARERSAARARWTSSATRPAPGSPSAANRMAAPRLSGVGEQPVKQGHGAGLGQR
jgi:ribose 1,5-bisphosphokinase